MSFFKMSTGDARTDGRDTEIIEEFDLFGETWVVHNALGSDLFRVSHKESGFGVPRTIAETKDGARKLAELVLAENRDRIKAAIEKAKR